MNQELKSARSTTILPRVDVPTAVGLLDSLYFTGTPEGGMPFRVELDPAWEPSDWNGFDGLLAEMQTTMKILGYYVFLIHGDLHDELLVMRSKDLAQYRVV